MHHRTTLNNPEGQIQTRNDWRKKGRKDESVASCVWARVCAGRMTFLIQLNESLPDRLRVIYHRERRISPSIHRSIHSSITFLCLARVGCAKWFVFSFIKFCSFFWIFHGSSCQDFFFNLLPFWINYISRSNPIVKFAFFKGNFWFNSSIRNLKKYFCKIEKKKIGIFCLCSWVDRVACTCDVRSANRWFTYRFRRFYCLHWNFICNFTVGEI